MPNVTFPTMMAYGAECTLSQSNRVADDFTLAAQTTLQNLTLHVAQEDSTTTCTITHAYLRIWNGPPDVGGSAVVFGDLTTNRLSLCQFAIIYRDAESAPKACNRPVMVVTIAAATTLAAGTYWAEFAFEGSLANEPIVAIPVTVAGTNPPSCTGGCNAKQFTFGSWQNFVDGGAAQGLKMTVSSALPRSVRHRDTTLERSTSAWDSTPGASLRGVLTSVSTNALFETGWAYRVAGDATESFLGAPDQQLFLESSSINSWNDVGGRGLFSVDEITAVTDSGRGATVYQALEVFNLSSSVPLAIDLFHFADIDLPSLSTNSAKKAEWGPGRIIRVTSSSGDSADYLPFSNNADFLVRPNGASDPGSVLGDGDLDDFDNSGLPFGPGDFTGGWQEQRVIAPSDSTSFYFYIGVNSPLQCNGVVSGLHCDGFESNDLQPWSSSVP